MWRYVVRRDGLSNGKALFSWTVAFIGQKLFLASALCSARVYHNPSVRTEALLRNGLTCTFNYKKRIYVYSFASALAYDVVPRPYVLGITKRFLKITHYLEDSLAIGILHIYLRLSISEFLK